MSLHEFPDGTKYTLTNIFPPIPDRRFDWCAQLDDNENMQGFGMTEQDAVTDLLRLLEECADVVGQAMARDSASQGGDK